MACHGSEAWERATGMLERSTARLAAEGRIPGAPVAELLAERGAAVSELASLDPSTCPLPLVDRLRAAFAEGELALERARSLCRDIQASEQRAVHLHAAICRLGPPAAAHRIDCEG
jgi:hypothetical protein